MINTESIYAARNKMLKEEVKQLKEQIKRNDSNCMKICNKLYDTQQELLELKEKYKRLQKEYDLTVKTLNSKGVY